MLVITALSHPEIHEGHFPKSRPCRPLPAHAIEVHQGNRLDKLGVFAQMKPDRRFRSCTNPENR